ncbi:MAG: Crp/Fnr family transcriptional regulator, partial [Acidobacteriota bacterium]
MTVTEKSTNRILAALPKKEYGQLFPKLDRVRLTFGENILEPGDIIRYFYFPESGIISLLSGVDPDYSVEIGMVGSEGVAGVPAFLGV